jgi:hypothetical protein
MSQCFIDLDEFRIDPDLGIYVYGEAALEFEKSGDKYNFNVSEISISPYRAGGKMLVVNKSILNERPDSRDALLFRLIADAVEKDRDGSITNHIRQKEQEDRDEWLSGISGIIKYDRSTEDFL